MINLTPAGLDHGWMSGKIVTIEIISTVIVEGRTRHKIIEANGNSSSSIIKIAAAQALSLRN